MPSLLLLFGDVDGSGTLIQDVTFVTLLFLEKRNFSLSTTLFFINEMKIDSADILFFALICEMNKVRVAGKSWVVANF